MAGYNHGMRSTYVPGMDDYYNPIAPPELVSPEPQRINHEMSNQIANGIQKLDLSSRPRDSTQSSMSMSSPTTGGHYTQLSAARQEVPHLSPFPKLVNPPPNVPQTDDELETTLENARVPVLNSNDPEMQLAWAQDALSYCGICADEAERVTAVDSHRARSSTPRVEHQLKTDAVNIVTFLADQQHPKAEFLRGMWLEWGRFGQREDKKEAFRCYSRAADKGYVRAEYRIGMLYESYNDPIKALRHYHRGADAGDAASCYRLGMMTLRGQHGQQQDFRRGIELIRKSAETADENAAQGAYVYGMLLARQLPQIDVPNGLLPYDERLAKENIEKAAYMRFAKAQVKMGSLYELGALGCPFDPALSIHYNALASRQGEADADMALSKWFLVGSEGLFPKNEELAYNYAQRAATVGLATAEFGLGYFHEIGMHVPINLEKAMSWYQKAASHGNEDAQGRITALANKQVLSKTDHENMAVSRIKSQRGSMIAARPDRFQQQPPARGSSVTPYPEDNGPPKVPAGGPRSSSAVPYPLEDAPPATAAYSSPRLNAGPVQAFQNANSYPRPSSAVNPEVRPSSAFQISPDLRSQSTNQVPQLQNGGQRPYPNPGPGPTGRYPSGPQQTPYDSRMRPGPAPVPGPGQRVVSGPPQMQSQRPPNGYGQGPQGYGSPQPNNGSGRMDIGYTAPVEDRRQRMGTPRQDGGAAPSHYPQQSSQQQQRPPPNSGQRPGHSPNPAAGRPSDHRRPVVSPQPPAKDSGAAAAAAAPAPKPTAPQKPAGPKTFDEMGVPAQQKEECIIM